MDGSSLIIAILQSPSITIMNIITMIMVVIGVVFLEMWRTAYFGEDPLRKEKSVPLGLIGAAILIAATYMLTVAAPITPYSALAEPAKRVDDLSSCEQEFFKQAFDLGDRIELNSENMLKAEQYCVLNAIDYSNPEFTEFAEPSDSPEIDSSEGLYGDFVPNVTAEVEENEVPKEEQGEVASESGEPIAELDDSKWF